MYAFEDFRFIISDISRYFGIFWLVNFNFFFRSGCIINIFFGFFLCLIIGGKIKIIFLENGVKKKKLCKVNKG